MCGACGRTVVADPVLGPVRTTRDLLLVAQVVNAAASRLPGGPVVRVAGSGWVVAGRTGSTTACDTVGQLWAAVISSGAASPDAAVRLTEYLGLALPASSALAERVLHVGIVAVGSSRLDTTTAAG